MSTHAPAHPETLILRRFSNIQPKPIDWLWLHRIPRGKLSLLAGDPGSGKTTLALDLAAHLSRGEPLPTPQSPGIESLGTSPLTTDPPAGRPLATLLLSPHDDPADTLRPKLEAMHANLHHIIHLENFHSLIPTPHRRSTTGNPPSPIEKLNLVIDDIPNLALLIIDPITHFLGLSDRLSPLNPDDPSAPNRPRAILLQLAQLAKDRDIAILLTTRLSKKIDHTLPPNALQKILGPLAFPSAARSVMLLSPLPPSPASMTPRCHVPSPAHQPLDNTNPAQPPHSEFTDSLIPNSPTHLLIPLKLNGAPLPNPLPLTITNTITWHPDLPLPSLAPTPKKLARGGAGRPDIIAQSAANWLRQALADGPVSSLTILDAAKANAISHSTLERAKEIARIQSRKQDWSGKWFWQLENETRPLPENKLDRQIHDTLAAMARNADSLANLDLLFDYEEEEELDEDDDDPTPDEEELNDDLEDDPEEDDYQPAEPPEVRSPGGAGTSEDLADFPQDPQKYSEDLPAPSTTQSIPPRRAPRVTDHAAPLVQLTPHATASSPHRPPPPTPLPPKPQPESSP
ncbi:MAG TPA: AAA family ATPase [Phycisphaerae bacterium]|nr:AAA family ATPase [Phycisphaerae bacterium]